MLLVHVVIPFRETHVRPIMYYSKHPIVCAHSAVPRVNEPTYPGNECNRAMKYV